MVNNSEKDVWIRKAFERQRELATGGVAGLNQGTYRLLKFKGLASGVGKSRGDLAAQESQKVSGESLFDLIVTVEMEKNT